MSSQDILKAYLLGELALGEQEEMEERFLRDREFFEQALIVEGELIDSYLDDNLSDKEKMDFVNHFLSTPQQLQKLRTAAAFRRYMSELDNEELSNTPNPMRLMTWLRDFSWRIRAIWSHAA